MPPRTRKKRAIVPPALEPPILLPPPTDRHMQPAHTVNIVAFGFLFLFSALLLSSQIMNAQEFRAGVSATVVATDYVPPERFPFEHWWNSLDTYGKLMAGGSGALAISIVPLGLLAWRTVRPQKNS